MHTHKHTHPLASAHVHAHAHARAPAHTNTHKSTHKYSKVPWLMCTYLKTSTDGGWEGQRRANTMGRGGECPAVRFSCQSQSNVGLGKPAPPPPPPNTKINTLQKHQSAQDSQLEIEQYKIVCACVA